VLIYFNKTLQERALALFHESLCHRGFLGLGSKESVQFTRLAGDFEALPGPEKLLPQACAIARRLLRWTARFCQE
jgi:chemotaxis protein methyltransferase CheR